MSLILTALALTGNFALLKSVGLVAPGKLVNMVSAVRVGFTCTKVQGRHSDGSAEGVVHIDAYAVRGGARCPLLAFCHPQKGWSFFSPKSKAKNSCPNIGYMYGSAVSGAFHSQRYRVSDK